jgi:uncharacterized delta-60 repeat protein
MKNPVSIMFGLGLATLVTCGGDPQDEFERSTESSPLRVQTRAGGLDGSFGSGGKRTTNFEGSFMSEANDVAIQKDGKIVVAGWARFDLGSTSVSKAALARYNRNGSLDTTFGTGGKVTTACDGSTQIYGIALHQTASATKIIVAGDCLRPSGDLDIFVVRYNANGSLDTSFGGGTGRKHTNLGIVLQKRTDDFAQGVAVQGDGKIVVGGAYQREGAMEGKLPFTSSLIARFNLDGNLDSSFGQGGKVLVDFPDRYKFSQLRTLIITADGKIVATGEVQRLLTDLGSRSITLIRLNANGTLDGAFGTNGRVIAAFGAAESQTGQALTIAPDGKIVVGATWLDNLGEGFYQSDLLLARFLPGGGLDSSFGAAGHTRQPVAGADHLRDVAVQADWKIVSAGIGIDSNGNSTFTLTRHLSNGAADPSFGSAGRVVTPMLGTDSGATALAIQPGDGRLVVAGYQDTFDTSDFAVVRYHAYTCAGFAATRVGTRSGETLSGTAGDDVIVGLGGDDVIRGCEGNDVICGGVGNDRLEGGAGMDICDGESGTDSASTCETVRNVP